MKKTSHYKIIVAGVALALSLPFAASAEPLPSYCSTTGPYGYSVTASQPWYWQGATMQFCLADNTRNSLFFGASRPWIVIDQNGAFVYQPAQGSVGPNPQPQAYFADSWNGTNQSGQQVSPGTYHIVFSGLPGQPSGTVTIAAGSGIPNQNYYPWASPSRWYALPQQTITFSGTGFAPNEPISVYGPLSSDPIATFSADQNGAFNGQGSYAIPFSLQNSSQTFYLKSAVSGKTISWNVVVGSFYPNVTPSTYYVAKGQQMSASATGFAPNELVQLQVNGSVAAQASADGSGNATFNFAAPASGGSFSVTAYGTQSHVTSSRTVTLMQ